MLSQLQILIKLPLKDAGRLGRSLLEYISIKGIFSSLAVFISKSCPEAKRVYLLISAIIPSQLLIRVRHLLSQSVSQGCFTDISINSNDDRSFLACPTKKSFESLSSIAKAIKIRLFISFSIYNW